MCQSQGCSQSGIPGSEEAIQRLISFCKKNNVSKFVCPGFFEVEFFPPECVFPQTEADPFDMHRIVHASADPFERRSPDVATARAEDDE
jgi:hypothetical protein